VSLQSSGPEAHKSSDLMNQITIASDANNSICEAVNCSSRASVQIDVKVGQLGYIPLLVCRDCVSKFRDEQQ
jgi:hypothetical protein